MAPTLTIAVPTFNRRDQVVQVVESMLAAGVLDVARVLVFDDGSTDATRSALSKLTDHGSLRVEGSPMNRGYGYTLIDLFTNCETEFLLATADDDFVIVEGVRSLAADLPNEKASLISTRFLRGQATYRGRRSDAPLRSSEVRRATDHAPGVLYRVQDVIPLLPALKGRLDRGCAAAAVYPQVVIAALLGSHRVLRWSSIATVQEGHNLPSQIADSGGRAYLHPASRVQQILDFEEMFEVEYANAQTAVERTYWREILRHHRANAFRIVRSSLIRKSPELARFFDRSATVIAFEHPRAVVRAWRTRRGG